MDKLRRALPILSASLPVGEVELEEMEEEKIEAMTAAASSTERSR